jgi:PAS domain S-box-containing protein
LGRQKIFFKTSQTINLWYYEAVDRNEQIFSDIPHASEKDPLEERYQRLITAYKECREREEDLKRLLENTNECISEVGEDDHFIYINKRHQEVFGYSLEELKGIPVHTLLHPEDLKTAIEKHSHIRKAPAGSTDIWRFKDKTGTYHTMECRGTVYSDKDGKKRTVVISHDISEQVAWEHQRSLVLDNIGELFVYYDTDLTIQWVNRAAAESVGLTPEELRGCKCYEIWQMRESPCEDCPVLRCLETGKAQEGENATPDGRVWFIRGKPIFNDSGEIAALIELGMDITHRKAAEERVKKELEEKKVLLQEVHHRVKNNLNVVASLLNLQGDNIRSIEDARKALKASKDRVFSMALVHQKLYQSDSISSIDMSDYIHSLCSDLVGLYARKCKVEMELRIDQINLTINQAVPCGLIINELITNAITHGLGNYNSGKIGITLTRKPRMACILIVEDDGRGFPPSLLDSDMDSLGLKLVRVLTEQLDGTLHFSPIQEDAARPGTKIEVRVPHSE